MFFSVSLAFFVINFSLSYCRNEEDFIAEFGYDEKTGRKVYKKLISIFDRLNELFDENTYEVLEKTYENY